MKKFISIIIVTLGMVLSLASCNKPQIIPDSKLRDILVDVYTANAYYGTMPGPKYDTLNIYTPVLEKYGYTMRDFTHTLENFSTRKSARVSDVVDKAIEILETESRYYQNRVAVLDTIDNMASRMFRRTVLYDSLITATKISDTSRLRITLDVDPGVYDITYFYEIDSTDKNRSLKTTFTFMDSLDKKATSTTSWMNARRRQRYNTKLTPKESEKSLEIVFGNYGKDMTRPNMKIDSLIIVHYLSKEAAIDSLDSVLGQRFNPFIYLDYEPAQEDSSTLRLLVGEADTIPAP